MIFLQKLKLGAVLLVSVSSLCCISLNAHAENKLEFKNCANASYGDVSNMPEALYDGSALDGMLGFYGMALTLPAEQKETREYLVACAYSEHNPVSIFTHKRRALLLPPGTSGTITCSDMFPFGGDDCKVKASYVSIQDLALQDLVMSLPSWDDNPFNPAYWVENSIVNALEGGFVGKLCKYAPLTHTLKGNDTYLFNNELPKLNGQDRAVSVNDSPSIADECDEVRVNPFCSTYHGKTVNIAFGGQTWFLSAPEDQVGNITTKGQVGDSTQFTVQCNTAHSKVSFKTQSGTYLSADIIGEDRPLKQVNRSNPSDTEWFYPELQEDGSFNLRADNGQYVDRGEYYQSDFQLIDDPLNHLAIDFRVAQPWVADIKHTRIYNHSSPELSIKLASSNAIAANDFMGTQFDPIYKANWWEVMPIGNDGTVRFLNQLRGNYLYYQRDGQVLRGGEKSNDPNNDYSRWVLEPTDIPNYYRIHNQKMSGLYLHLVDGELSISSQSDVNDPASYWRFEDDYGVNTTSMRIALKANNGKFIHAPKYGKNADETLKANKNQAHTSQVFQIEANTLFAGCVESGDYMTLTTAGQYFWEKDPYLPEIASTMEHYVNTSTSVFSSASDEDEGNNIHFEVRINTDVDNDGCVSDGDKISLLASDKQYVSVADDGSYVTSSDAQGDNEEFTVKIVDNLMTDSVQAGRAVISQEDSDQWTSILFDQPFSEPPVVVLGPASYSASEETILVIRNVTEDGFEVQINEWDYLDGIHQAESFDYIAALPGVHDIGGLTLTAQSVSANHNFTTVTFPHSFESKPVAFAQLRVGEQIRQSATTRMGGLSAGSVKVRLEEQEADNGTHADETINVIAIESGEGVIDNKRIMTFRPDVTHDWTKLKFETTMKSPLVVCHMETVNGGDPATLRLKGLVNGSVQLKVQEEQSSDPETDHTSEKVSCVVMERR